MGIISDTHIPGRAKAVPHRVFEVFEGVELILHAGDLVVTDVLSELDAIARVHAVLGNMDEWDLRRDLPEKASLDFGGLRIGMIHDSGLRKGRRERLRAEFPAHRVVVFGHSHQPLIEDDGEMLLLNPGSACDPRRAKIPTVALLELHETGAPKATLVSV